MVGIIIISSKIIFIFENTFVILLCTPENSFKDFLILIKLAPKFKQTINAAAAFKTLCLPNNFTLIFSILLIFFVYL